MHVQHSIVTLLTAQPIMDFILCQFHSAHILTPYYISITLFFYVAMFQGIPLQTSTWTPNTNHMFNQSYLININTVIMPGDKEP